MNENSIGQLLTDCLRNQLIEGYTQFPEEVALWHAGKRSKMSREQAREFLAGLYTGETLTLDSTAPRVSGRRRR